MTDRDLERIIESLQLSSYDVRIRKGKLPYDNPDSQHHYLYQQRVNHIFITALVVMFLLANFINYGWGDGFKNVLIAVQVFALGFVGTWVVYGICWFAKNLFLSFLDFIWPLPSPRIYW